MRSCLHLVAGAAALGFAAALHAADWPHFLGPNANGISPETGINKNWQQKPPPALWNLPMQDDGYAGPSVAGGMVYIIDRKGGEEVIRALDLSTGKEAWQFPYRSGGKNNHGFGKSTPTVDNGKVYTVGQEGQVHCLDAKTGQKIWAHDLMSEFGGQRPTWDYAMSPFIDGEKVIFCPGGPTSVVALNKNTGETVWKGGGNDKAGYATPAVATIDGKRQYLIFSGTRFGGVDVEDGKLLWMFPWKTSYDVHAAVPIAIDNSVFINTGYNHGSALVEIAGGQAKARWESKTIISRFTTPICVDGYAYCTGEQNGLVCMDLKTGQQKWKQPGFEWGGLVGVDGVLIVLDGKNGNIVMVKISPDRYEELGRMNGLGGQSWSPPIVADGKLIVRNQRAVACYDLK